MGRYRYRTTIADRYEIKDYFMSKISVVETGCWIWSGRPNNKGYGHFYWPTFEGRKQRLAHRVSFELFCRSLTDSREVVDHLCRVPLCVNPKHLDACTQQVNILRGTAPAANHASKTACPEGHPYDKVEVTAKKKTRRCMTCRNAHRRAKWAERRDELLPLRRQRYADRARS